jgi:type IV pilus assembly protein PilW
MLETQVQQDLRTAADLIQQDMRRVGFRGIAEYGVWAPPTGVGTPAEKPATPASASPYSQLDEPIVDATNASLGYRYARFVGGKYNTGDAPKPNEYFGVKWDDNTLSLQVGLKQDGSGNWQPITDPDSVLITNFGIKVEKQSVDLKDFCDVDCGANCPKQQVRLVHFTLTGVAKHDARVVRTLDVDERMRADAIIGACPS